MSTTDSNTPAGEHFQIGHIHCQTNLPAALWRSISIAERPAYYDDDVTVVEVDDDGVTVVVIPQRHYAAMVGRIRDLERWLGECLQEGDQP